LFLIEGSIKKVGRANSPFSIDLVLSVQAEREAAEKAALQAELDRAVREDEKRKQRCCRFVVVDLRSPGRTIFDGPHRNARNEDETKKNIVFGGEVRTGRFWNKVVKTK